MKKLFIFVSILFSINGIVAAQDIDGLFNRLQGFEHSNEEFEFFNTDGIEITAIPKDGEFTARSLARKYKQHHVKASEITKTDTALHKPNFYVSKTVGRGYADYYFVQHKGRLLAMSFASITRIDQQFERDFIMLFISNKIPDSIYQSMNTEQVNFGGREFPTRGCRWMNPNNLQCPYNGQMNWSSFKTLEAAQRELDEHFKFLNTTNGGKVISDEQVDVVFEGQDVKARKVIFDFTGVRSALVGMSGGKTLTIYEVVAPVRNKYLECVMSYWNNDKVGDSGLPALLNEVMVLK